jgi:hypothetical protein
MEVQKIFDKRKLFTDCEDLSFLMAQQHTRTMDKMLK